MTHLNYSLEKLGKTFNLPKELIKTEMDHDGIDENNWRDKKDEWLPYVKNGVHCTAYFMLDIVKLWKILLDLV